MNSPGDLLALPHQQPQPKARLKLRPRPLDALRVPPVEERGSSLQKRPAKDQVPLVAADLREQHILDQPEPLVLFGSEGLDLTHRGFEVSVVMGG